jgi:hypothetical protein
MLRSRRFSASRTRGREHGRGLVPAAAKAGLNYPFGGHVPRIPLTLRDSLTRFWAEPLPRPAERIQNAPAGLQSSPRALTAFCVLSD